MSDDADATPEQAVPVLIVDDEEDIREMLAFQLAGGRFATSVAASGREALELAARARFAVAIVDLRMPGMDGIETLTALRRLDPAIEVVIATAYASPEVELASTRDGACAFLRKPFALEELMVLLERALAKRSRT